MVFPFENLGENIDLLPKYPVLKTTVT